MWSHPVSRVQPAPCVYLLVVLPSVYCVLRLKRSRKEISMAYRFQVNEQTCINCGICVDLCPVRCLDMTRPSEEGTLAPEAERQSPIPVDFSMRGWMMLAPDPGRCLHWLPGLRAGMPNQCHYHSRVVSHRSAMRSVDPSPISPSEQGWQPLDAYTRASPEEPGEAPWGEDHAWHVAERRATWQSWRSWLGDRKEDLRAPCQAACPVGTNAGLYVSSDCRGPLR